MTTDLDAFASTISSTFSEAASGLFRSFVGETLEGLYPKSHSVPPFTLRGDAWAAYALKSYLPSLMRIGPKGGSTLTGPFQAYYDKLMADLSASPSTGVALKNHFDYLR